MQNVNEWKESVAGSGSALEKNAMGGLSVNFLGESKEMEKAEERKLETVGVRERG